VAVASIHPFDIRASGATTPDAVCCRGVHAATACTIPAAIVQRVQVAFLRMSLPYLSTKLRSKVNPSPATPMIVSATVQVFRVWGTVILKNSLISQNPASFT
jgi:hypothetical protein